MGRRDRIVRDVLEGPAIPDPSPLSPSPREMMSSREEGGGRREEEEAKASVAKPKTLICSLYIQSSIFPFFIFHFNG